ncbi:hypothetical protein CPC08DRAFT_708306 [Agrocybe pediades]|nr:hypothetical protein CPC08DRAFT_708306 [Agrocybe pediades]
MPQWLDRLLNTDISRQWTNTPQNTPSFDMPLTEKGTFDSTTPTKAASDDNDQENTLPPPVVQGSSASYQTRRGKKKSARMNGLSVHWARFKKRIGTGTAPSSSSVIGESAAEQSYTRRLEMSENIDYVDEVVVDRNWSEEIKSSITQSEHGASPEKSGTSHPMERGLSDHESVAEDNFWGFSTPLTILRYRAWPLVMEIFSSRFMDDKAEQHYAQESWFLKKSLALWASLWLIANWVLGCIFIPHNPIVTLDKIFYFGIAPCLSLPVVVMVMYDWPRDRPYIYQIFLVVSIWCWSFYQVIFILSCGYYTAHPNCQNRDFLGTFYYTTALQTIALFGLKLNRFPAALGALVFFLFSSSAVIPVRRTWGRTMINFFFFQAFLIYVHYVRESSERRLYTLRDQLKIQFKATQKAQVNERKAADSKRRLTSYVFHEVRVPLNTALLAVQNMEASGTIAKDQEIEFNALCGSLSMMSKVLNDVLDFNRMDSGKFESASRPYGFHQVMRSLFVPLRLATDARGLKFEADLDPNIDKVARKAAYMAMGQNCETIRRHILDNPDVDGVVTGDETRLRQIITNLASNACKFTPAGGQLSIRTKLVIPTIAAGMDPLADLAPLDTSGDDGSAQKPLSDNYLSQHNMEHNKPLEWIVVRIEVADTGYGIKPQDMAQSKLFSAFNQTEQGRQQGGKGTGLGLALVRQIVKLSGGRLGVQSKPGEGSTFWVELPLGVGRRTFITGPPNLPDGSNSEIDTLQHTARQSKIHVPSLRKGALNGAVDAADLKASKKSADSTPSNDVMQGIMEQGGRVELVLRPRGQSDSTKPEASPTSMTYKAPNPPGYERQTNTNSGLTSRQKDECPSISPSNSMDHTSRPPLRPPDVDGSDATIVHTPTSPTPPKPPLSARPTFVQLPSPEAFPIDESDTSSMPLPTGNSNSSSEKSASNLKIFDNSFTRGSPSASLTALNIEPNMPVLVVDDDQLTRTLMKRILTRLGCEVSCAENGEVALEMILGHRIAIGMTPSSDISGHGGPILEQQQQQQEQPMLSEGKYAVVFLDNQMPVMSGLKAVEKLRQLGRSDFVVGVTGNALLSDQEEYLQAGADRVLTKPVLERSLRDILVIADEKRKAKQADDNDNEM